MRLPRRQPWTRRDVFSALAILLLAIAPMLMLRAAFVRLDTIVDEACGVPLTILVDADGTQRPFIGDPKSGGSLPAVLLADEQAVAAIRITRFMMPRDLPLTRWTDEVGATVCVRNALGSVGPDRSADAADAADAPDASDAPDAPNASSPTDGAEPQAMLQAAWADVPWTADLPVPPINGPRALPDVSRWAGGGTGPLDGHLVTSWTVAMIAAGAMQLSMVIIVFRLVRRQIQQSWRRGRGQCGACGHPAIAGVGAVCPECGTRYDASGSEADPGADPGADAADTV
ncbi:MAG: hypothetical protein AB8G96_03730 [Phycisphaerales bacterium]